MPELPEVETVRRQLDEYLSGRKVEKVEVLRDKSFAGNRSDIEGAVVERVGRKAKMLEVYFKDRKVMVLIHLKMTGQLIFVDGSRRVVGGHPTADWVKDLPSKHTRVRIYFVDGSSLFFNDMRVFGWVKIAGSEEYLEKRAGRVPDVVEDGFDERYLSGVASKCSRAIKLLILDQAKMGGMGNIYANDALFLAGINPMRRANSLSKIEIKKLVKQMKYVLELGIKHGGASASDEKYVNASGLGGKYQEFFQVYERAGLPCLVCEEKILKVKLGGRGTYYCEKCQK